LACGNQLGFTPAGCESKWHCRRQRRRRRQSLYCHQISPPTRCRSIDQAANVLRPHARQRSAFLFRSPSLSVCFHKVLRADVSFRAQEADERAPFNICRINDRFGRCRRGWPAAQLSRPIGHILCD